MILVMLVHRYCAKLLHIILLSTLCSYFHDLYLGNVYLWWLLLKVISSLLYLGVLIIYLMILALLLLLGLYLLCFIKDTINIAFIILVTVILI